MVSTWRSSRVAAVSSWWQRAAIDLIAVKKVLTSQASGGQAGVGRACCPRRLDAARSEDSPGLSWCQDAVAVEMYSARRRVQACVAADGGRSVASGADGSASGREQRERSEARR